MIITTPPRRRVAALLTALAVTAGVVAVPAGAATAADGPAPAPAEKRIIAGIHTDAVSTFLDDGRLTLGSKADVPEGSGTRFAADDVWFHVAENTRITVPANPTYEFLGAPGATVWMAPESNPGAGIIWPGFNTESIAPGGVDGDRTAFTLVSVEGPGELEVYTGGSGFAGPDRRWSSADERFRTTTVGRTHMHANWAFTAPGTYDVTVRADAAVSGVPQTATATYTFVVGDLPEPVATATSLTADATAVKRGDPVRLDATVAPAAAGHVEFRDGDTVLGHERLVDGKASFRVDDLALGSRTLTARFVPETANLAAASASSGVVVTVAEPGAAEEFGLYGLQDEYRAGDLIDLRVGGVTLTEGQYWRWLVRSGEGSTAYVAQEKTATFSRDATTAFDGVQVAAALRTADGKAAGQQTAWYTVEVVGENMPSGAPVDVSVASGSFHQGDAVDVAVEHAPLTAGQTGRWVVRPVPYGVTWEQTYEWNTPQGSNPYVFDAGNLGSGEYAFEIVGADGAVAGRSAAISFDDVPRRELQMDGIASVYRAGDTLEARSTLYPERDGVTYQWSLSSPEAWVDIPGATGASLSLPVTSELDGQYLYLVAKDEATSFEIASASQELRVTDAAPGEQLVLLDSLAGHYHQGGTIRLRASADPVASDTDTYRWLWQRPDQDRFTEIPGAVGASHDVRAQQALDGTIVKAELRSASGDVLGESEPATILVDDHGAAPAEKVTVTGLADHYHSGDTVSLSAKVAPESVLTRWDWFVQRVGEDTPMLVADQKGAELTFAATAEYDGASVFAQLSFDDGTAYVASAPAVVRVDDHNEPEPSPGTDPTPAPGTDPTPAPGEGTQPGTGPLPSTGEQPRPGIAPTARTGAELDAIAPGGISISPSVRQGEVVTIGLGADRAGQWVAAWMFSTPALLNGDWTRTDAAGALSFRVPIDTAVGDHRVAVFAADGSLIGWAPVSVTARSGDVPVGTLPATGGSPLGAGWVVAPTLLLLMGGAALVAARRRSLVRE